MARLDSDGLAVVGAAVHAPVAALPQQLAQLQPAQRRFKPFSTSAACPDPGQNPAAGPSADANQRGDGSQAGRAYVCLQVMTSAQCGRSCWHKDSASCGAESAPREHRQLHGGQLGDGGAALAAARAAALREHGRGRRARGRPLQQRPVQALAARAAGLGRARRAWAQQPAAHDAVFRACHVPLQSRESGHSGALQAYEAAGPL